MENKAKMENNFLWDEIIWPPQIPMSRDEYAIAEASNRLGIALYQLLAEEKTNVVFSPFGISTALAMTLCGASDETASEMRKVLGYEEELLILDLKLAFQKLLGALDFDHQKYYTLKHDTALLSDTIFPAKEEYLSLADSYFKADVKEVDFVNQSPNASKWVNKVVKLKSDDPFPKIVDSLEPSTALIIFNGLYFKGWWLHSFEETLTMPEYFYNKGDMNNFKQVDMMHRVSQTFSYAEMESYRALELPYKGDMFMLILLPKSCDGLGELEKSLSFSFIQDLKPSMSERPVLVALPKFRLEYSTALKDKFQCLGMNRVCPS